MTMGAREKDFLTIVENIKHPESRLEASQAVARLFGAENLLFFTEDPLLKIFLPAQGYSQTLPGGKDWRRFLEAVLRDETTFCDLPSPFSGTFKTVKGFHVSEIAIVVFLGAPAKLSLTSEQRIIFSLVAAALIGETALIHSEGQSKTLRESAEMYRSLAGSLESTKHELQSILTERDQALEVLRQTLLERKKANESDAKLLTGTQILLSTLNYEATLQNIVDIAVAQISDWCVIYVRKDPGSRTVIAAKFAVRDKASLSAVQEYLEKYPSVSGGPTPVGKVIETQLEQIFAGLSEPRMKALTESEDQGQDFERCRPRAIIAHPMIQAGEFVGVIAYGFIDKLDDFTTEDILMAQRWTGQATSALTNASLLQETRRAVKARDELMSVSSHEIRTPITAMKLQLQLAKRQIDKGGVSSLGEERVVKLIEQSDRQISKLTRLVDDMLDLSRINTGKFSICLEKVNLTEVVNDTLERLIPHLNEGGCAVQIRIAKDLYVQGDVSRLEQVITNLLTNAGRYGAGRPIQVTLDSAGTLARLEVRDHGAGIEKADSERIFGKFERAVSRNEVSGLGLGLFIVRQILQSLGGTIHVESVKGEGAGFIAEIPLALALQFAEPGPQINLKVNAEIRRQLLFPVQDLASDRPQS